MILFLDLETTGLPLRYDAPYSDLKNWPRIASLSWALFNPAGKQLLHEYAIIKPDGFSIPRDRRL